jgi:hypothetical protein
VQSISNANFGPLIAYLVPGVTVLLGVSEFSPAIQAWFAVTPTDAPTISGFLYLTVASLAVGMTVTAIRWAIVDTLHAVTGLPPPLLDFSQLAGKVDAFNLLIAIHYVHFQFYANMFIATAIAYACYRIHGGTTLPVGWVDGLFVVLELIFFATSRNTLSNYYNRTRQLLSAPRENA